MRKSALETRKIKPTKAFTTTSVNTEDLHDKNHTNVIGNQQQNWTTTTATTTTTTSPELTSKLILHYKHERRLQTYQKD
ncbi:unnamed protein product, partial [Rotaria sp. Silwood2]